MTKRFRTGLTVVSLVLAGTFLGLGCQQAQSQERALARVQDRVILEPDFRKRYVDYLLSTGVADNARLRRLFIDDLVNEELLIAEAHAAGIAQEPGYVFQQMVAERKLLLDLYARTVLFDTLQVTEREVAEAFVWANTQLRVRHLFARTLAEAEVLQTRLQQGATFEALAREVFADTALANNGGDLGLVSFDELDPAFEEVAYRLEPGVVSEPVQTSYGYSLIRVDERFTKPLLTESDYAQRRDRLEAFVRRRKQLRVRDEHVRTLTDRLAPAFHEPSFTRLHEQVTGQVTVAPDEGTSDPDAWMTAPLVTFGPDGERRTWTAEDLRDRAQYTDPRQRAQVRTRADLASFIQGLFVRDHLLEQAEARALRADPRFPEARQRALEDWVLQHERQRLRADATVSADSVRAHYERYGADYRDDEGTALPFEAVQSGIRQMLQHTYSRTHLNRHLDSLRAAHQASIQVDYARVAALPLTTVPSDHASMTPSSD
ncbi:MAG: peptidylprolyl isomerase [Bacteroidota bacterium]